MNFDDLLFEIDHVSEELMDGIDENFANIVKKLITCFMEKIPGIIVVYNNPLMIEKAEEAVYWPAQVERIIEAINRADEVYLADVLCNETKPMLVELRTDLMERGLYNE